MDHDAHHGESAREGEPQDPETTASRQRRRRRFPAFLAVPITLIVLFWILAWAVENAAVLGML